jgi:exodeoxyribonuclease V beta subunit
VHLHYGSQVSLYSLAIAKLLSISSQQSHAARFGGLLYCFLRGLDEHGAGVWTARPSWDDLLSWEDALRSRRNFGTGWGA